MNHYNWNSDIPAPVSALERAPAQPSPRSQPPTRRRADIAAPVSALERGRPRATYEPAAPRSRPQWGARRHEGAQLVPERRLPRSVTLTSVSKKFASTLLELALLVLTLGVGWCLWALMVSWKGQTPARHVLGTRVVSAQDGRPLGIGGMIFDRGIFGSLVQLLSIVLTLSFTAFIPIWDDRNQTVCDKMSGSIVVNDRDQLLVVP